jgi:hypothetical protein
MFGKRILIIIPHPDDEVVGCTAAMARAQAQGARIYGIYLGHGCLRREALWPWQGNGYQKRVARRILEAECAARFLGLTVVGKNTCRAAREIWPQLPDVYEEVQQAIQLSGPDRLWVPAYEGGNPDHDAVNALASTIKSVPAFEFSEYHFAIYRRFHGRRFDPSPRLVVIFQRGAADGAPAGGRPRREQDGPHRTGGGRSVRPSRRGCRHRCR